MHLLCTVVSSVCLCIWCGHLYLVYTFKTGVHVCIWCMPLNLLCMFVPSVHICFWCVPLYPVCTFVFGVYLVSVEYIYTGVHACITCVPLVLLCTFVSDFTPLYLVCAFVSSLLICIWCAHFYQCAHLRLVRSYLLSTTLLFTQACSYSVISTLVTCPLCLCQILEQPHETMWQELYIHTI